MSLRRWILSALLGILLLAIGFGVGWFTSNASGQATIGRTLVLDWGDRLHDDGKVAVQAMYGAHAFVTPDAEGYAVTVRIYIHRPDAYVAYMMDCGVIGHAHDLKEGHEKWGKVAWTQDAVVFGDPDTGYHVSRKDFQRHR